MSTKPTYAELEKRLKALAQSKAESKLTEKALKESEERYNALFNRSFDCVFINDFEGNFLDANTAALDLLGYAKNEIQSLSYASLIREDQLPTALESMQEIIDTGAQKNILELELVRKNGEVVCIETKGALIYRDEKPYAIMGIARDISHRKRVEADLENQNRLMMSLLDNLQVGVFMVAAPNGKPLLANKRATELLGRGIMADATKNNIAEVYAAYQLGTDNYYPKDQMPIVRGLQGESHYINDMLVVHPDGTEVILEVFGSPVRDKQDNIVASLVSFTDITDRKKATEEKERLQGQLRQAQKLEAIGTLAGGIAHDFNNILGIILGNTELALDDVPEWNPTHFNLEEIKTAGLRAKDIVRQLLNFSRKAAPKKQILNMTPVLLDAIKFLRSTIPAFIDIRQNIQADADAILADATQIHQVMLNLCTNASQAMAQTGGIIKIIVRNIALTGESVEKYPDLVEGDYVMVAVSDTGPGIDPEIQNRIFDPYFTTKTVDQGSGMGLAVVHGIVTDHNGGVYVDSEPGNGATFTLFFPVATEKPERVTETKARIPLGKETILLVDDEAGMLTMGQNLIGRLGYTVECALTPFEAQKKIRSDPNRFDLVITDMTMPQMTGVALSKIIKAIRRDLPVIICTGHSDLIDEEKAKEMGFAAYIMKPMSTQDIAGIIRDVLDNRKKGR
jgi:PAS domain S-box-containing protein